MAQPIGERPPHLSPLPTPADECIIVVCHHPETNVRSRWRDLAGWMRPVRAGIPGPFTRVEVTSTNPLGKLEKGQARNLMKQAKIDLFH